MSRKYVKIDEYEKQILEQKRVGKTNVSAKQQGALTSLLIHEIMLL